MATVPSSPSPPEPATPRVSLRSEPAVLLRQSAWAVFGALVVLDIAAALIQPLGTAGVALWYLSYAYFIVFAAIAARDIVRNAVPHREPLVLIVILVYVVIVVTNLTDARSYSAEAGHEIDCALRLLTSSSDHGFRGTCLFGYPARQFFLPALPSLLFGRSQLMLNLGGDLYYLLGVVIFAGGVIRYRGSDAAAGPLAALLLTVFLHVYFWSHFILIYEQSIFPLSFALIGGGLLLYYLSGESLALPLGGLLMLYLIESYTPSLAVYGLAAVVVLYLGLRAKEVRATSAALVGGSLIVLLLSYRFRGDLNIGTGGNPHVRQDVLTAFEHAIYLNHGVPITSPMLVWPLIIAVALCLAWQLGLEGFAIGCWVIAVFLFAVASHGYALNSFDFRLHRMMIIFPVLITLGAVVSRRLTFSRAQNALTVVVIVMLATGIRFHLDYRNAQQPDASLAYVSWLHSHAHLQASIAHPVPMWWAPGTDQFLPAVRDVLDYFDPGLQGLVIDQSLLGSSCGAATQLTGLIVVQEGSPCYDALRAQTASGLARFDGAFVDVSGRRLALFQRKG